MMSNMIQNQSMLPSFMKIEEDETMVKLKQGIVTILTPSSASSLRRTLSADMSSKKWMHDLQQQEEKHNQDSFKMKKIASSAELTHSLPNNSYSSSSSSCSDEGEEEEKEEEEEEAERERLAIWSSILKNKKEEQEKSKGGFDTWGSIMSMKSDSDSNSKNNQSLEMTKSLPVSVTVTPYVHPLVKRSKSSLSDKSLEICTESLGSETGSDSLLFSSSSSSSPSFPSGESEKVVKESEQEEKEEENNHVAAITKSKLLSHPRCFPPPLPSLSFHGCNKSKEDYSSSSSSSLHMKPHRDNGRLVLQAVSLPSNNNFNAQRQDGRLVLTFANDQEVPEVEDDDDEEEEEENYDDEGMEEEEEFEEEEEEEVFEEENDEEEEEEEEDESEVVMEKKAPLMSSGITTTTTVNSGGGNLHRLTLMMNNNNNNKKTIGLVNRNMNPNWSVDKFNKKGMNMNLEDVNVSVVARLIPSSAGSATSPPPPSSFNLNAYEYFWKTPKPSSKLPNNNNNNNNEQHQQLLVLRGKNGDYLVHNFKGCKDSRRSLLFWEPYCIATS